MCFGFLGIQFGFALQNSNVSRIFQTLGAAIDDIPILWIAAPISGLIVQPIIGYMSDKTWNRFGRRRPYFLFGAICTTIAIFIMPNSPVLWVAAGMLWMMDASINIAMEPMRAFVGDMLPQEQRTRGFAMQSFFIGVGAVVASSLPWMMSNWFDVSNTAPAGQVPDSVIYSFYFGGTALLLAMLWTIFSTKEYSPEQIQAFTSYRQAKLRVEEETTGTRSSKQYHSAGVCFAVLGVIATFIIFKFAFDQKLYILTGFAIVFGLCQVAAAIMQDKGAVKNGFYQITHDVFHMPTTMKQLAVVQFFSWFALFSMWIYTTSAVTEYHFGSSDPSSQAFNEGADWVGVLFASYNGFAALAAFIIPIFTRLTNRKITHAANMVIGGCGLISFIFIRDPQWLIASMVAIGIAWASILSIPYAILSCSLPFNKMGVYMGIFNFFIVIPQILAASILGLMVRELFEGKPIYALVSGGIFMFCAAAATLFVRDEPEAE
ncbi:hypothetical protein TDB9533_02931 [Thalassocella blandensis]|nr:hypothetical protein TDB9533_02931 [Thalassocella blandensis]